MRACGDEEEPTGATNPADHRFRHTLCTQPHGSAGRTSYSMLPPMDLVTSVGASVRPSSRASWGAECTRQYGQGARACRNRSTGCRSGTGPPARFVGDNGRGVKETIAGSAERAWARAASRRPVLAGYRPVDGNSPSSVATDAAQRFSSGTARGCAWSRSDPRKVALRHRESTRGRGSNGQPVSWRSFPKAASSSVASRRWMPLARRAPAHSMAEPARFESRAVGSNMLGRLRMRGPNPARRTDSIN